MRQRERSDRKRPRVRLGAFLMAVSAVAALVFALGSRADSPRALRVHVRVTPSWLQPARSDGSEVRLEGGRPRRGRTASAVVTLANDGDLPALIRAEPRSGGLRWRVTDLDGGTHTVGRRILTLGVLAPGAVRSIRVAAQAPRRRARGAPSRRRAHATLIRIDWLVASAAEVVPVDGGRARRMYASGPAARGR